MNAETNCFKGYNIKATTNEDGTVNVETWWEREHHGSMVERYRTCTRQVQHQKRIPQVAHRQVCGNHRRMTTPPRPQGRGTNRKEPAMNKNDGFVAILFLFGIVLSANENMNFINIIGVACMMAALYTYRKGAKK